MNPDLIKRAAAHYPYHPKYQRAWLRMITLLGDKWLLAQKVHRGDQTS